MADEKVVEPEVNKETKVKPVVIISMTEKGQLVVQGPIDKKDMVVSILADAIKIVANHQTEKSPIIQVKDVQSI